MNNHEYTETRTLSACDLRALCIRHNWYTCGDCEEYEALFNRLYDEDGCPLNLTTAKLAEIAEDIMEHSEISDYTITAVMYELNKACSVYFDMVPAAEPAEPASSEAGKDMMLDCLKSHGYEVTAEDLRDLWEIYEGCQEWSDAGEMLTGSTLDEIEDFIENSPCVAEICFLKGRPEK